MLLRLPCVGPPSPSGLLPRGGRPSCLPVALPSPAKSALQGGSPKAQSCPGPPRSETLQPIPDSQQVPILQWLSGACRFSPSPTVCTLSTHAHWTHPSPGAHPRPPLFCSSLCGRSLSFTPGPWPPPMCAPIPGPRPRRASPVGLATLTSDAQRPQGTACCTDPWLCPAALGLWKRMLEGGHSLPHLAEDGDQREPHPPPSAHESSPGRR